MRKLSCYLVTYNRADYLAKQIDSILEQTYRDFDLYILDNASTDNTKDIICNYKDERIHYIRHEYNIGGINNIKYAFDNCDTEYIIVLHDDDICDKTLFEKEVRCLDDNLKVTMVSSNAMLIDKNDNEIGIKYNMSDDRYYQDDQLMCEFLKGKTLIFPTIMYRNIFLKERGITIDEVVGPCADVIFCWDILSHNGCALEIHESLLKYRIHDKQDSIVNNVSMNKQLFEYIMNTEKYDKYYSREVKRKIFKYWYYVILCEVNKKRITDKEAADMVRVLQEKTEIKGILYDKIFAIKSIFKIYMKIKYEG